MDKQVLENQIRMVMDSSDEWLSPKQVATILKERFDTDTPHATVRARLDSLVKIKELDFKSERYHGHEAFYYRRVL